MAFNLVILFRFTIWAMLYFCELIFQWQFNFQSFFGVIVLSPSSTGPCWCCLFGRRCYLSWDVWCFLVGEENLRLTGPKILSWHFFFPFNVLKIWHHCLSSLHCLLWEFCCYSYFCYSEHYVFFLQIFSLYLFKDVPWCSCLHLCVYVWLCLCIWYL